MGAKEFKHVVSTSVVILSKSKTWTRCMCIYGDSSI